MLDSKRKVVIDFIFKNFSHLKKSIFFLPWFLSSSFLLLFLGSAPFIYSALSKRPKEALW
jgi:hypothetical protein